MTRPPASRQRERVAIVTGATGAIGGAIAAGLARAGFAVVLPVRELARGRRAVSAIQRATRAAATHVRCELVDLALRESIEAFAARWSGPLHVLVNNAAETPRRRQETSEGIERQLASNVLGYLRLMRAFEATLAASAPARVVNVASYWAGGLDVDDLEFRRRRYDNDDAYRQSKQADRMLSSAIARRWRGRGVTVNACHPGDVPSKLASDLGFGGHESPEQGAATPLWLATDPDLAAESGGYFEHRRAKSCGFSADEAAVETLFERVSAYDG